MLLLYRCILRMCLFHRHRRHRLHPAVAVAVAVHRQKDSRSRVRELRHALGLRRMSTPVLTIELGRGVIVRARGLASLVAAPALALVPTRAVDATIAVDTRVATSASAVDA